MMLIGIYLAEHFIIHNELLKKAVESVSIIFSLSNKLTMLYYLILRGKQIFPFRFPYNLPYLSLIEHAINEVHELI